MRYFIELSYNGTAYHGWQIQPNAVTVQEVLESALSTILNEKITVMGAGRTDAGVHAKQMFAHFNTLAALVEAKLVYKLNTFLPFDIAVTDIFKVKPEAHARFDAISRSYIYRIGYKKNVFTHRNAYVLRQKLDLKAMNTAGKILLEYKDFQCFSKTQTDVKTFNCDITNANWILNDEELQFMITADRFLRNMVRAIVGTMINVGVGKISIKDFHAIIHSKNRCSAGYSVPAHGLYLSKVLYPKTIKL